MQLNKFEYRAAQMTTDTGVVGVMDAAGDVAIVEATDLDKLQAIVNQVTDAGTCTIHVDGTYDGINWDLDVVAALSEASFDVGNNVAFLAYAASDAHGMPLNYKQFRFRLTAVAGGGVYSAGVAGVQRDGYEG